MGHKWFVIVNPTSGNGSSKKKWPLIFKELQAQEFNFEYQFTEYHKHAIQLIHSALNQGFTNFICVGGDGTLHNIINGIFSFPSKELDGVKVGIIPIGTGNDWVKTYNIPKNYKKAIEILKHKNTFKQDIGKINLLKSNKTIYFNNLAGIGFDGYVANKINDYKQFGFIAYLIAALSSLKNYKKTNLLIELDNSRFESKSLMLLIGLCNYSGGGMRLTKKPISDDGLFDISHIESITLFTILFNILNLFNGKIVNHKLINTFKSSAVKITLNNSQQAYIQADGEVIKAESFYIELLPKSISFIVPENKS